MWRGGERYTLEGRGIEGRGEVFRGGERYIGRGGEVQRRRVGRGEV